MKSIPLTPVEIQDLELATGYRVYGRCRMENEEGLWGHQSPVLSFQTPPSGEALQACPTPSSPLPEVCTTVPLSLVPPFLLLGNSKRRMDIGECLRDSGHTGSPASVEGELWGSVPFPCACQEAPNNNHVDKTEVTMLMLPT